MREVTRDDHWKNEREANDKRRDDYVVTDAADAEATTEGFEAGMLMSTGPSETELVQVALLMRLYDLGMAILTSMDEDKANQVFEAHEKGEHFNPPVFIPDVD